MRTRKGPLLATLGILLLPFLISSSLESHTNNSAGFTPLVYGGHLVGANNSGQGAYCHPCEYEGVCVCDEGETPDSPRAEKQTEDTGDPNNPEQGDPNLGPLALLAVLALLIWRFGR